MSGNTLNMNGNTSNTNGNVSDTNDNISNTNDNASDTDDDSLLARLRGAYVTNAYSKEVFIPRLQFESICTFEAVKDTLVRAFPKKNASFHERCARAICCVEALDSSDGIAACPHTSALSESGLSTTQNGSTVDLKTPAKNNTVVAHPSRKIFAILVLIRQPTLIEPFLEQSLCDDLLPFTCSEDCKKLWSSKMSLTTHIQFPQNCDDYGIIKDFCREQWSVLVPHFDAHTTDNERFEVYELHEKEILPIRDISDNTYYGGYGLVERVWIHTEHHGFNHESFALKTMYPSKAMERERLFQQELDAFRKVNPGGHIIEICAAIKQGDSRSFLFPWAEGGNLSELWARAPGEIFGPAEVQWSLFSQWVCTQCHGIIRDLKAIHGPDSGSGDESLFGIHSDIKPDNILHFTDSLPLGSLKVSDLGLMKFHRQASRTKKSASMGNAYQTYRSPEHDKGMMRSRKIDIWAFGCLFAEFLTWAIRGYDGVEAFKTKRMEDDREPNANGGQWLEDNFFTFAFHTIPKRKKSIKVWFTELINDLGQDMKDTFFPEFLQFIRKEMLHPSRDDRADCTEVEAFLEERSRKPANSPYWRFNGTVPYQNGNIGNTLGNGTVP